jgi:hypothetical protein
MLAILAISTPIRVLAVALALSTLSFAAGVAGDLTMVDPPRSGERVVLRIPPELPADTIRAAPLPPLIATPAASAEPRTAPAIEADASVIVLDEKLQASLARSERKPAAHRAHKPKARARTPEKPGA